MSRIFMVCEESCLLSLASTPVVRQSLDNGFALQESLVMFLVLISSPPSFFPVTAKSPLKTKIFKSCCCCCWLADIRNFHIASTRQATSSKLRPTKASFMADPRSLLLFCHLGHGSGHFIMGLWTSTRRAGSQLNSIPKLMGREIAKLYGTSSVKVAVCNAAGTSKKRYVSSAFAATKWHKHKNTR